VVPVTAAKGERRPVVVLADDGEPASDVAWAWLIGHRWEGWELEVVTVRWTALAGGSELKPSRLVPRRPPQETALSAWDHVEVTGDPRVVLLGRSDAGLMVLGCHHRGHLAGLWVGSTAEWLLMHPPAPILIARHGHPIQSVALCVDGSPHAERALQAFFALPWSRDVALSLVSVDDGTTDVERSLKVAGAALPAGIWPARVVRLRGPSRRELVEFVRANQIDLVVMGTRGLTGWTRMRVGSTVSALLKDGSANLLIAHVSGPGRDEA
jgi:nucleotide-binding universal stress UspA family protein